MNTIIILLIAILSTQPTPCVASIYPDAGTITAFDFKTDTVYFTTANGEVWSFTGIEDWEIGDDIAVIFYDNGTTNTIYDDKIISVRYCSPIKVVITQ